DRLRGARTVAVVDPTSMPVVAHTHVPDQVGFQCGSEPYPAVRSLLVGVRHRQWLTGAPGSPAVVGLGWYRGEGGGDRDAAGQNRPRDNPRGGHDFHVSIVLPRLRSAHGESSLFWAVMPRHL